MRRELLEVRGELAQTRQQHLHQRGRVFFGGGVGGVCVCGRGEHRAHLAVHAAPDFGAQLGGFHREYQRGSVGMALALL